MLRILIAIFFGLLVGSALTLSSTSSNHQQNDSQQVQSATFATTNTENSSELAQLREENLQLKNKIKSQQPDKNTNSNATTSPIASNNCESQTQALIAFFTEKDNIFAEAKDIKSVSQHDTKLHNEFYAEEKNETWSATTENKFLAELKNNDATRDIVISSINCRSSTCEVKIPVANTESKNKIMETLSNPSFSKNLGFNNSVIKSGLEIAGGEMTLYIKNKNQ